MSSEIEVAPLEDFGAVNLLTRALQHETSPESMVQKAEARPKSHGAKTIPSLPGVSSHLDPQSSSFVGFCPPNHYGTLKPTIDGGSSE